MPRKNALIDARLRAFLEVAGNQSITAAAERIGLTQPALSKLLKRLEADVGATLLHRHRRGTSLTVEGEALLRRAQAAGIELEHAQEEISAIRGERRVELRLHCGVIYALDWIHAPLARLAKERPDVQFTIDAGAYADTVARVLTGRYDAMFGFPGDAFQDRRLTFAPIKKVRSGIFGRVDHPLAQGPVTAADLAATDWTRFEDVAHTNERLATYLAAQAGQVPRMRFRTGSLATALELARSTGTLICLPEPLAPFVAERGLMPLASDHDVWTFETGVLTRQSSEHVELVQRLLQLVREEVVGMRA